MLESWKWARKFLFVDKNVSKHTKWDYITLLIDKDVEEEAWSKVK